MKLRNVLLVFLLLISPNTWADGVSKYLIIDTMVIESDVKVWKLKDNYGDNDIVIAFGMHGAIISYNPTDDGQHGIRSLIHFDSKDSLRLSLVIDDKKSLVDLTNLENCGDTIHIKKWTVFHNNLPDTIDTRITYYHHTTDSIHRYKSRATHDTYGDTTLSRTGIAANINGTYYQIPLCRTYCCNPNFGEIQINISHGYAKKRDRKRELKGLPYNYFVYSVKENGISYSGKLRL